MGDFTDFHADDVHPRWRLRVDDIKAMREEGLSYAGLEASILLLPSQAAFAQAHVNGRIVALGSFETVHGASAAVNGFRALLDSGE